MAAVPAMSVQTISPGEMQLLLSRAGLILNPGQVADLVLAWRQVEGLIASLRHDRPLADDMALTFRLPSPSVSPSVTPATPATNAKAKPPVKAQAKAKSKAKSKAAVRQAPDHPVTTSQGCPSRPMTAPKAPFLTIAEASRLIVGKRLSPVELVKELLARIEKIDPHLNSYLLVTERQALTAARAAERAVMAGRRTPLLGIPLAYKDIYETAGVRTTAQSRILADNMPKHDAETVRRLGAEGAVMLGKLATHEFAIGGPAFDLPWPPARNPGTRGASPWVELRLGRRRSGGARAGRVRLRYRWLDPAPGGLSRYCRDQADTGSSVASWRNSACASWIPLGRWHGRADCAILLDALAGHDPLDPASVPGPHVSYAAAIATPIRGLRIGMLRRFYEHDVPASPEMLQMMSQAAATLRSLGCRVEDATLPP